MGMGPQVGTVRHDSCRASVELKFVAPSQGIQCKGFSHMDLVLGVEGCKREPVAGVQV